MNQTLLCLQHSKTCSKRLGLHLREGCLVWYSRCLTGGAKAGLQLHGDLSWNGCAVQSLFLCCIPPFMPCLASAWSHAELFWHTEMAKPHHSNRMRKLVHAKRRGNFAVKAKEPVRPCRWDCRDTTGAICYPTAVGQTQGPLKAWSSPEGNISEGLPGQKEEMGPCKRD